MNRIPFTLFATAFVLLPALTATAQMDVTSFGAKGDGSTDDYQSIQAAINASRGIGQTLASPLRGQRTVFLPAGVYVISRPLSVYSGVVLEGVGQASSIKAANGFSGTALLLLAGNPTYYSSAELRNLEFDGTLVAAIRATAVDVTNASFRNLTLNTAEGLILATYTQGCLVEGLYSRGPINKLLHLRGNYNVVRRVDKEGGTGTTADPYILIEGHSAGNSTGNVLENVLLEQTTSPRKSGITLSGVDQMIVRDVWWEPTLSDGYVVRITGSKGVRFEGYLHGVLSGQKIKIDTTREVWIDRLDADGEDVGQYSMIEVDSGSRLHIDSVQSRRGTDAYQLDRLVQQSSGREYNREIATDGSPGYVPVQQAQYLAGQNLFINPSFEAGRYGWTFPLNPTAIEEYVQSEVGDGVMGHFRWATLGSREIRQAITVPASWVGRPMTLTALVKITGTGFAVPYLNGAGIRASTGYQRVSAGTGWGLLTQTFVPQTAGQLLAGIDFVSVDPQSDIYVDETNLGFGTLGVPNLAKAASLEVGGRTRVVAPAAPTTGTWKVGDVVWAASPAESGVATFKYVTTGWICTVAGSPGTWLEMRTLTGN